MISEEHKRELSQQARRVLEQAADKFRNDPADREATLNTISALKQIACVELGLAETDPLMTPANALMDALDQLDDGVIHPLLKKIPTKSPPDTQKVLSVKAIAVYFVHLLNKECNQNALEARKTVAIILEKKNFRGKMTHTRSSSTYEIKGITERTLRDWCEQYNSSRRDSTLRTVYNLLVPPFPEDADNATKISAIESKLALVIDAMDAAGVMVTRKPVRP
ncbi:hypothetical protein [Rhodovarius sp.]|uniref:hypothetical protein n=1 Tax=Rhodovarius sp. TaxID=2972673 RepID=UPI0034A3FDF4